MKAHKIDWLYIRNAVFTLAVSLVICALLFIFSNNYYHKTKTQYDQQLSSYHQIQNRYQAALEDVRLLHTFSIPYQKLVKQGLIGNEHRLYWVETVRKIAEDLKLKKVTYRIDPQTTYTANFLENSGEIGVYASRMTLKLDLLHEGDLLYLIDGLNKKIPGSFHVNKCNLKRSQDKFVMHPSNTNLFADCEFTWFTLKTNSDVTEQET